jgi:hypothetical protein
MNGTAPTPLPGQRAVTAVLYWGSLVTGLFLPLIMQIAAETVHRGLPLAQAWSEFADAFWIRLFAPGDGRLFLSLFNVAPFAVYAIFALLHLGRAHVQGAIIARRRRLALIVGAGAMLAVSAWGHYAILTAKGSTAAIGFLFLPFYVLAAAPAGYGLGRLWARGS